MPPRIRNQKLPMQTGSGSSRIRVWQLLYPDTTYCSGIFAPGDVGINKECNVAPGTVGDGDEAALESLLGFEKLGWVRKEKMDNKSKKIAQGLSLPVGATKFSWKVPLITQGEVKQTASSTSYQNHKNMEEMQDEEALSFS